MQRELATEMQDISTHKGHVYVNFTVVQVDITKGF